MPPIEMRRTRTSEYTGASLATGAIDSCSWAGLALITWPFGRSTRTQLSVRRSRSLTYGNDCSPQCSAALPRQHLHHLTIGAAAAAVRFEPNDPIVQQVDEVVIGLVGRA